MELSCVRVDLERVFEYGQAYVALSRCTSSKSLFVRSFTRNSIRTHPKVSKYLNLLNTSTCGVNKKRHRNQNPDSRIFSDVPKSRIKENRGIVSGAIHPPVASKRPCLVPATPEKGGPGNRNFSQQRITSVPETPQQVTRVLDTP
mmetsp:Transcript_7880/g.10001  ORF Transcript_7880/g.10001 Transcript_7880/m.10001 type:complete len:145 (+) Transcript_7880:364-798(+)